jgi:hypothetical protein
MFWELVNLRELVFEVYLNGFIDRGHFNGDEFCEKVDNIMGQSKKISR